MTSAYAPSILRKTLCHASRTLTFSKDSKFMKTINLQKQKSLILILLALFAVAPLVGWASSSDLAFSFKYGGTTYYTDYLTTAVYLADNNSTITVRNSTGNFSSTKNSNNTIPITYYYINSNSTGTAYSYNPVLNNT